MEHSASSPGLLAAAIAAVDDTLVLNPAFDVTDPTIPNPAAECGDATEPLFSPRAAPPAPLVCSPRTIINEMDALPSPPTPVLGKGIAPAVKLELRPADNDHRKQLTKELVRSLLGMMAEREGDGVLAEAAALGAGGVSEHSGALYVVTRVMPTLLPGLVELMRSSEHVATSRRLGSGRRPILPCEWLGMYLMRHNPRHLSGGEEGGMLDAEMRELVSVVVAEIFAAKKAARRREQWAKRDSSAMMKLWKRFCPNRGDELHLDNVREALEQFSQLLGLSGDRLGDAEHLFALMDVDGSGGVSFEEFEEVVGGFLANAQTLAQRIAGMQKRTRRLNRWVHGMATRKIEQRLAKSGIDAKGLFEEFGRGDPREEIDRDGTRAALKCVAKLLEDGVATGGVTRRQIEGLLPSTENGREDACYDFPAFERAVASLVDAAAERAQRLADTTANAAAESRAADDVAEQAKLMVKQV